MTNSGPSTWRTKTRRASIATTSLVTVLVLTGLWLLGCQEKASFGTTVDQSSPEAAVHALYDATQRGDIETYQLLGDPDDPRWSELVWGFKLALSRGYTFEAQNLEIDVVEQDNLTALVRTYYSQRILVRGRVVDEQLQSGDVIPLVYRNGRWFVRAHGRDAWLDEAADETIQ